MTTALFILIGSRGDNEPALALLPSLLAGSTFTHIHVLLQPDYLSLVPSSPSITAHPLPFSSSSFQTLMIRDYLLARLQAFLLRRKFDILSFQLACIASMVSKLVLPALPTIHSLATTVSPSLILATSLAANVASTLSDALRVPSAVLNLQPNVPTAAYPNYIASVHHANLAAEEIALLLRHPDRPPKNIPAYRETYDFEFHSASRPVLNRMRAQLNLAPLRPHHLKDVLLGRYPRVHIINSYPARLVPPGKDWAPAVHQVPVLADQYLPPGWDAHEACPRVAEYLAQGGEKPIVVTFGSTQIRGFETTLSRAVLHALKEAGVQRAILLRRAHGDIGSHRLHKRDVGGFSVTRQMREWGTRMVELGLWLIGMKPNRELIAQKAATVTRDEELRAWAGEHVLECEEAPQYGWLLPRCAGLVCHGGAGTVFAGLAAGVPVVIAPILGDQFFWGPLLQRLGLGAVAEPDLYTADGEAFLKAVRIVRDEEVRERAQVYAEQGRSQGKGSDVAARVLENIVAQERDAKHEDDNRI